MRKQWEGSTLPQGKERSTRTTTRCSQIARSTTPRWWEINWSPNLTRSVRGVNPTNHFLLWVLSETFEFFVRTIEIKSHFSYLVSPWTTMNMHHCAVRNTSYDCCLYFNYFRDRNMVSWSSFYCISSLMKINILNNFGPRQSKTQNKFVGCLLSGSSRPWKLSFLWTWNNPTYFLRQSVTNLMSNNICAKIDLQYGNHINSFVTLFFSGCKDRH